VPPNDEALTAAPPSTGSSLAVFSVLRHPDTIDIAGPYEIRLRQVAGTPVSSGRVEYEVEGANGEQLSQGHANLQADGEAGSWTAEIPGAPAGRAIRYHFSLTTNNGESLRHPADPTAVYRFRVLSLQVVAVSLPNASRTGETGQKAALEIQATAPPEGELIWRRLSISLETFQEVHLPLAVEAGELGNYRLSVALPQLAPGELADFYFHLIASDGTTLSSPADAPVHVYTLKLPLRAMQHLPIEEAFVLGLGFSSEKRWIGLKGGGAWMRQENGAIKHLGLEGGLPSGVVRFVLPDPTAGQVYFGTDRGVVVLDPGEAWTDLTPSHDSAWGVGSEVFERMRGMDRAGPGALSPLDGTLLFQLQGQSQMEQSYPPAIFLELRDGILQEWQPVSSKERLVGLSTATFDVVDGCWLLGGFVQSATPILSPVIVRRCAEDVEQTLLPGFLTGEGEGLASRVIALERDPSTGTLAAAIEFTLSGDPLHKPRYGVFLVEAGTGALTPIAPDLAAIETEITALASDWRAGRLLAGSFGEGLWQVSAGVAGRLSLGEGMPTEITALEADLETGTVLVGTSVGEYELSPEGHITTLLASQASGALPADALPMDVQPGTGRILGSSYAGGLVELERSTTGVWVTASRLRPGQELPGGLFGDAQYRPPGGILVIMHSKGLLEVDEGKTRLFGPENGLLGPDLLRILALPSGETWLAYTPQPFGPTPNAGLQLLQDGQVLRTVELTDRDMATIGDWVFVPERGTVFAATRAGVVEIGSDGSLTRLSRNSATAIARDPSGGVIGVVGVAIERWQVDRFVPLLFQVNHPRRPAGGFHLASPVDLAIAPDGVWYLLFQNGVLVLLDPQGQPLGVLDAEDGLPASARRLLADPTTGEVFVGSNEGLVVISPATPP